jgi:hypothetical protein
VKSTGKLFFGDPLLVKGSRKTLFRQSFTGKECRKTYQFTSSCPFLDEPKSSCILSYWIWSRK